MTILDQLHNIDDRLVTPFYKEKIAGLYNSLDKTLIEGSLLELHLRSDKTDVAMRYGKFSEIQDGFNRKIYHLASKMLGNTERIWCEYDIAETISSAHVFYQVQSAQHSAIEQFCTSLGHSLSKEAFDKMNVKYISYMWDRENRDIRLFGEMKNPQPLKFIDTGDLQTLYSINLNDDTIYGVEITEPKGEVCGLGEKIIPYLLLEYGLNLNSTRVNRLIEFIGKKEYGYNRLAHLKFVFRDNMLIDMKAYIGSSESPNH